uniref:DNA repair protein RAD51 homolog 3 n=1 Tax=Syphacia muris TaxID=451379 RepID=A0A0N5AGG0_9BILA
MASRKEDNCVKFIDALHLYNTESKEQPFSTGIAEFDELFGGYGIPPGTVLELVGCSSTGKTQLCMQLCVMAQKQSRLNSAAVYIDTEGSFSTLRLCQIAQQHFINEIPKNFLNNVMHTRCTDLVQLTSAICRLQGLLESSPQIGLIIVDSIAMPFRGETDYTQSVITHISSVLSQTAIAFRCLVVVVNHVTTKFDVKNSSSDGILAAALGTTWSHRPSARAWLCPPYAINLPYKFHLVKSSFCAQEITETTSKLCKERVVLHIAQNSFIFTSSERNHVDGSFFEISLNTNEFFSTLTMAGVSEEFDEIFMEFGKDLLFRCINPKEQTSKIRLTKIRNLPHLKIELKSLAVTHEMPVDLIPTRQWKQYIIPEIVGVKVAVFLPQLYILRSLISSVKNMGLKYIIFQGNQSGELYLIGDMDNVSIQIYFSNLSCFPLDDADGDPNLFHEVRVSVREVFTFLRSINTNFTLSRILLKIVPDKLAGFFIQQGDASFTYGISATVV